MIASNSSRISIACVLTASALFAACSPTNPGADGGTDAQVSTDGGLPSSFFPAVPPAFTSATTAARTVNVSVSGEALAQEGYPYSNQPNGEPVFVDGWSIQFTKYIVVVGNVKLNQQGVDPSMRDVLGPVVAERNESFIVDLHKAGPLAGAGGGSETALPLFVFNQPALDPSVRYAFSYDTVPANSAMRNVNLAEDQRADVELMLQNGWTHLFAGTATYQGRASSATVDPTFQMFPRTVNFTFGFRAAASYLNCHNPEIGEDDTPANRGIQPNAANAVRAQLTMHTDHFFWKVANVEGESLHFDPFAARAQGFGMADPRPVGMVDLMGVNPMAIQSRDGMMLRDRGDQTMGYTPDGPNLIFNTNGAPGVIDLRDMAAYNARAQGHMNSDGLCFVKPNGPITF